MIWRNHAAQRPLKRGHPVIKKTRDDYNKIARHFAATRTRPWPEFSEFSPFLHSGQRVLDWGCGSGRLVGSLSGQGIEYYGIDQSIELIKVARQLYASEIKKGEAHFFCTARCEKKFPKEYFDIVFMIASFFHLPDDATRRALLAKTHQELKPGGKLIMLVWNLGSEWALAKAKKGWEKIGPNDFLIPWRNPKGQIEAMRYYHHFSEEELKGLLVDAGFSINKIGYSEGTRRNDKGGRNLIVIAHKPASSRGA